MQAIYSPSVRRRRISSVLRRYREERGLTTAQVGAEVGWTQQKVSKIESGEQKKVSTEEIDALLSVYDVESLDVRASLHECARLSKQRGWWSKHKDAFPGGLPDFETEASVIRTYDCQVIAGLLQTPDYAEAVLRADRVRSEATVTRLTAARVRRQEILNRVDPPLLIAIIDEAALHRTVGSPKVMHTQLLHLTHLAARHNVEIQVLPFSAGAHPATAGSFVVLDFPHPMDASIGYVETPTASLWVEEDDDLHEYVAMFGAAQGSALSPSRSLDLINAAMQQLEV